MSKDLVRHVVATIGGDRNRVSMHLPKLEIQVDNSLDLLASESSCPAVHGNSGSERKSEEDSGR